MLVHTLNYTAPEGKSVITIEEWVQTLPAEQQAAYADARKKQDAVEAEQLAAGHMIATDKGVIHWSDTAGDAINTVAPEWKDFFTRYLEETGIQLNVHSSQA